MASNDNNGGRGGGGGGGPQRGNLSTNAAPNTIPTAPLTAVPNIPGVQQRQVPNSGTSNTKPSTWRDTKKNSDDHELTMRTNESTNPLQESRVQQGFVQGNNFDNVLNDIKKKLDAIKMVETIKVSKGKKNKLANARVKSKPEPAKSKPAEFNQPESKPPTMGKPWNQLFGVPRGSQPPARSSQQPAKTTQPLTTFPLFSSLHPEIRLKIWQIVMSWSHIIELEHGPDIRNNENLSEIWSGDGIHAWCRVCPKSRKPPAILHINSEAREEAKKVYELRTFDMITPGHAEKCIYYNPEVDIIYLGENTCIQTLTRLGGQYIPRIGIHSSGKFIQCCNMDDETYHIDGGISPMQGLHGFYRLEAARESRAIREAEAKATGRPMETHWNDQWDLDSRALSLNPYFNDSTFPGIRGLRDVFWVVQSNLCRPEPGEVGLEHTFRAASTNGLTRGQHRFKARILSDVQRVENHEALYNVGKNKWLDENKPSFHWVSLSVHPAVEGKSYEGGLGVGTRVFECMLLGKEHAQNGTKCAKRDEWKIRRSIEHATGCYVIMQRKSFVAETPREIGFRGSKKSVAAAKKMVLDYMESIGEQAITVYNVDQSHRKERMAESCAVGGGYSEIRDL